jgi:4-amino-4-deoxy-L-arabinose transferase-like glycosyltransferase
MEAAAAAASNYVATTRPTMDSRQSPGNPASDGRHPTAGLAVLLIIAVYVAFWTLRAVLSSYNLDTHGDMVENFAWGIGWQLGYYKHPPFFAWMSAMWFLVFPRTNTFYYLLSMTSVAVAVWAMWRISTRFFNRDQQILLVASAFFLPPLTFLAQNYNATSAMLPLWALTFLFYLRLIERRSAFDAILLGLLAALAILAKYHSAVLLLAIGSHAVLDRGVRPILRTPLPWLAVLAGGLGLAPHLVWMIGNDFVTVRYASEQGTGSLTATLVYAARFLPAALLYALPVFLLLLPHRYLHDGQPLFALSQWLALRKTSQGRALIFVTVLPPLVTILLGLVLNAQVSSLWAIPFFVFMPFFLVTLLPGELAVRQKFVVPAVMAVYGATLLALAPSIRERTLQEARGNSATPVEVIADAVQSRWHAMTDKPLAIVAGDDMVTNGVSFYAPDRPYAIQQSSLELTPWIAAEDIERAGGAYICVLSPADICRAKAMKLFGRVDAEEDLQVPVVAGARGPAHWDAILLMRYPMP